MITYLFMKYTIIIVITIYNMKFIPEFFIRGRSLRRQKVKYFKIRVENI